VKSLVNADDEMLGAEPPPDEVVEEEADELALELALELVELEEELPQPAATAVTTSPSTHTRNRPKLITARSSHRALRRH
jgi:hypothetical protein